TRRQDTWYDWLSRPARVAVPTYWEPTYSDAVNITDHYYNNVGQLQRTRNWTSRSGWGENWTCLEKVDTGLSSCDVVFVMLLFECHRRKVAQGAMASPRIVERLDVVEDGEFSLAAGGWDDNIQLGLGFERAPKRFNDGVVVTVASAA